MTSIECLSTVPAALHERPNRPNHEIYARLLTDDPEAGAIAQAFLQPHLAAAGDMADELPADPEQLLHWSQARCAAVAAQYASYLASRQAGEGRRYFRNTAHALYFLQHVGPTKAVDGAWLAGVLHHWQDVRFDHLQAIYLEELGEGVPRQNHVLIYRQLLAEHGCDDLSDLGDEYYLQGAIQLALGHGCDALLPEVIGYNLGYEQLPLHLLISAYELRELGIDPHYFRLHVTIDNASTGHARRAVKALQDLLPAGEQRAAFYRRMKSGYRLNDLGPGSTAVIQAFDLKREALAMLERKAVFGRHMHSDYCRIENRTINQWLATPGQMEAFLDALIRKGWIKRGEDPTQSRFWRLIDGSPAVMFGVFSVYEKQLLHDWIADGWQDGNPRAGGARNPTGEDIGQVSDSETLTLHKTLQAQSPLEQMNTLIPWLAPQRHWRPAGLFATRRFMQLRKALR
ncbi:MULTISPECIES: iron-containing redox enzyme family protein [unclassified Pseudomonas]|uniref:iron-containing redox enzyme family protein n=1 Tax=unclassified Pseudomonas TaxID=196821 RepID=UPI000A1DA0E5|nr:MULTISPECIES: iron-containing redox enzyme family protein [unclassified Pseudomonas]